MSMTVTHVRSGLIPAARAALGLAPTVRSSKPTVVRLSSHATADRSRQREQEAGIDPQGRAGEMRQRARSSRPVA